MKTHSLLLTLALAGATTLATGQMTPSSQGQQPSSGMPDASQQSAPSSQYPSTMGNDQTSSNTNTSRSNAKPMVDDQTLEKQIHDQLAADPSLSGVQATVQNGVVHLEGTVASKADRKKAKELAKSVPGVTKVKEKITVSASGGTSASATSPNGTTSATSSTSPSTSTATS